MRRGANRHCILFNSGNAEELIEATELGRYWRAKQSLMHSEIDDTIMGNELHGQDEYDKGFREGGLREVYWKARENENNESVEIKKMEDIRKAKERQIEEEKDVFEATDLVIGDEDDAEMENLALSELFPDAQVAPLVLCGQGKGQERSVDAEQQERYWKKREEEVKNAKEVKKIEENRKAEEAKNIAEGRKAEERRIQKENLFSKVTDLTVEELLLRIFTRRLVMMLLRTPVKPLTEEIQGLTHRFPILHRQILLQADWLNDQYLS